MTDNQDTSPSNFPNVGLAAFDSLRAEDEEWLADYAFSPPAEFANLAGMRSFVVYGAPGSGKTALRRALENLAKKQPRKLTIHWSPQLLDQPLQEGTQGVERQLTNILENLAEMIIEYLAEPAQSWKAASGWAKSMIAWFMHNYLQELFSRLVDQAMAYTDDALVHEILAELKVMRPEAPFRSTPTQKQIIGQIFRALNEIGISDVWVLVDGLEGEAATNLGRLAEQLNVFMSSLFLFDGGHLTYKLFLPIDLESLLADASVIKRDRISRLRLRWSPEQLQSIIAKRIAVATGQPGFTLSQLYDPSRVSMFLERCGGLTPRAWLEYLRSIGAEYLSLEEKRPLTKAEWRQARLRVSISPSFDPQSGEWSFGAYHETLTEQELAIMRYLCTHQGRYCSLGELYRHAYLPLVSPNLAESRLFQDDQLPKEYEDIINTSLWRLRNTIEPDPRDPVYIVTRRNLGVQFMPGEG